NVQLVDMEVIIDSLTHTWDADLDIYFISPFGDTLELSTDNGGSGDNYIGTVFDDQATTPITAGSAPFTGVFQPEGYPPGFGQWNGMDPNGDWMLYIMDDFSGDDGTLHEWSILVTVAVPGAPTATLPFMEGFNDTTVGIPNGWTQLDMDGGDEVPGADWTITDATVANVAPYEGIGYIANNFQAANSQGLIDEWLITPQLLNYQSGMELSFWLNHVDNIWPDSVMVLVSTTGNDPADFTMIDYINCPTVWTEYRYNLENYGVSPGDNFYIAFRYYIVDGGSFGNSSNYFGMDLVTVDFPPVQLDPPTNVSAVAGDSYVDLFWGPPPISGDTVTVEYHDGSFESQLGCSAAGACELAVRFTPSAYPAQLLGFQFTQQNGSTSPVDMHVYLDPAGSVSGPQAPPDYVYAGLGGSDGTYTMMIPDMIFIPSGDFYLGALEVNGFIGMALDTTNQNANLDRNWASVDGGNTFDWLFNVVGGNPLLYGNLAISAFVLTPNGLEVVYPNVDKVIAENTPEFTAPTITDFKLNRQAGIEFLKQHGQHQFMAAPAAVQGQQVAAGDVIAAESIANPSAQLEQKMAEAVATHPITAGENGGSTPPALNPAGVTGYNIYRSTDGVTFSLLASVDSSMLTYHDAAVTNGTTYWYYLTTVYPQGESGPSDTVSATPMPAPTEDLATHTTPKF
ncbi:MAG: hypothetical protein D6681_04710, partial [Calditrichaeota bacterium]